MWNRKIVSALGVVALFGALASATPALAADFEEAIAVANSVTGPRAPDHATDWAKAVGAKRTVVGTQVADLGPYGFLAQAR